MLNVSPRNSQAITTVKSGLLTWKVLAFAGPSRVMDSKKNQRPRKVEKTPDSRNIQKP